MLFLQLFRELGESDIQRHHLYYLSVCIRPRLTGRYHNFLLFQHHPHYEEGKNTQGDLSFPVVPDNCI